MALSFICCWMGSSRAFALDQIDGVYQIGNAQDLEDFSNMVASGNGGISGALTAVFYMGMFFLGFLPGLFLSQARTGPSS